MSATISPLPFWATRTYKRFWEFYHGHAAPVGTLLRADAADGDRLLYDSRPANWQPGGWMS